MTRLSYARKNFFLLVYFAAWICYFGWFWSHALFLDKTGNFWAGLVNIWGDWAGHFTMSSALALRGVSIQSPFLIGVQFSYPFFADLISALLLRAGVPFISAFVVPSFVGSVLIVIALYIFYTNVFRSRAIAVLASLIFLLNGGVGAFFFAQDMIASPHPIQTLLNPPHEYTRIDAQHIKWISVIDSMIIPQRAFTFGLPITLFALSAIWWVMRQKKLTRGTYLVLIAAGLTLGTLPFIHTHSFLAAFLILSCWSITDMFWHRHNIGSRLVMWTSVLTSCVLVAVPFIKVLFFGHVDGQFLQFFPGWLAREFQMNWLLFWWKNWGITPLMAIIGTVIAWKKNPRTAFLMTIPFFGIFLLANLFLFQPFSWDNTKLIAWSSVGISGLAAYAIFVISRHKFAVIGGVLFLLMILSGSIDAYWDLRTDLHSFQMYTAAELELAQWTQTHTSPSSIWLTSDQHNHWLYNLTGRQPLMAFRGWLWTYGYDYRPVENDVLKMFAGDDSTQTLLKKYHVQYVVIGPSEIFTMHANESFFTERFPIVKQTPTTMIYQIPN